MAQRTRERAPDRREDEDRVNDDDDRGQSDGRAAQDGDRGGRRKRRPLPSRDVIEQAVGQFEALTGKEVEAISSFSALDEDDGWRIALEVVELERVPSTTNLMGTYEIEIDSDGGVLGFEQARRYVKGRADDDE